MDDESFRQLYQSAHRSTSLSGGKGGQRGRRAPARLSDATTLSATSRSRHGCQMAIAIFLDHMCLAF